MVNQENWNRVFSTKLRFAENKKSIVDFGTVGIAARWLRKNKKNEISNK